MSIARVHAGLLCLLLLTQSAHAAPPSRAGEQREGRTMRILRRACGAAVGVTRWGSTQLAGLAERESRAFAFSLRGLGVVGAGGLIVTSAHGLSRARLPSEKLDASSDLAWGLRGLAFYAAEARASSPLLHVAKGLGVAGSLCQIGAGACRIRLGMQQHDRSLLRLGALDVGVGLLSLTWNLAAVSSPWLTGAYVTAIAGREIYANREPLKKMAKQTARKIRCAYGRCRAGVSGFLRSLSGTAFENR